MYPWEYEPDYDEREAREYQDHLCDRGDDIRKERMAEGL